MVVSAAEQGKQAAYAIRRYFSAESGGGTIRLPFENT
jgi:hypothetical protein